jgi:hypothetical protein
LLLVPFALGKVIDIIYSMDQLKGSSLEQQKLEISKRLKWVCLGNISMLKSKGSYGDIQK